MRALLFNLRESFHTDKAWHSFPYSESIKRRRYKQLMAQGVTEVGCLTMPSANSLTCTPLTRARLRNVRLKKLRRSTKLNESSRHAAPTSVNACVWSAQDRIDALHACLLLTR